MAIFFRTPSKRSQYRKGHAKSSGRFDSQEFVFDISDDELTTSDQNIELKGSRSRFPNNGGDQKKEKTAQYVIQPEDSLQSVALKFGCQVAELKRVNHLLNDKEFYALWKLKIPTRDHSLLSEILCSSNQDEEPSDGSVTPSRKTFHVSISHMLQEEGSKESKSFLQEMDRDIQRIVEKTQSKQTAIEEELNLNSPRIQPLREKKKSFDGASWGISWCSLLVAIVILGVLAPTLYGIYILTYLSHTTEDNLEKVSPSSYS